MHRASHRPLRRADLQAAKPCQSDHEAKANRLLLPAKQGTFGSRPAPKSRGETPAQPAPRGKGDGGNGTGAGGRDDGAGSERTSSGRDGREIGRAAEVQGQTAQGESRWTSGSWMEVRPSRSLSCLLAGGDRAAAVGAESFVPYRDWREGAAGSRKLKAASSRGSVGRSSATDPTRFP